MSSSVLITGSSGILGGATLAELIRSEADCEVLALVRAASATVARARLQRSLARFDEPGMPTLKADGIEILCGDLVDPKTYVDPRLDGVTHVVHAAADTSFRSVRNVRRVNILGTLALAHRMRRAPRLQRFLHVGTAFSCGLLPTRSGLVHEDEYPRADVRHLVEYTSAKAEAELLLAATAPELPLVIARPSVIVGHSRLGCAVSASIFWFYRTVDLLRRTTWPLEALEDAVPVDYAARALCALLWKPDLRERCYHVSAGAAGSCSWHELAAAFARHHGERHDDPYRVVDWDGLIAERERFLPRLGPGDEERLLLALSYYHRFPSLVFDNARLLAEGVPPPPRLVDYLDLCITHPPGRSVYEQMIDDE